MSTTNQNRPNRPTLRDRLRLIIGGVTKHFASPLVINGATLTPSDLTKAMQAVINLLDAAAADEATWHASVKAARDEQAKLRPVLQALKSIVTGQFGNDLKALDDFGYSAPKAAKLNVADKAKAASKAKATRALRHTVGPKAKLKTKAPPQP